MSDQAERLRQLVFAGRVGADAGASSGVGLIGPAARAFAPGPVGSDPAGADDRAAAGELDRGHDRDRGRASVGRSSGAARASSLLFTSGKGGVGTSNLVLNLAIALGELGQRVLVVDADWGPANPGLLCGPAPARDPGEFFLGRCGLEDVVAAGPGGIRIVSGAHALRTSLEVLSDGPSRLLAALVELESGQDFVLVDGGSGLGPRTAVLAGAADRAVVVSTPEPTALADAHAALLRFRRFSGGRPALRVVVNQARSAAEAREVLDRLIVSSRQFLGMVVAPLGPGAVRADPRVPLAVRGRRPFLVASPSAPAARGVRRIARALVRERRQPHAFASPAGLAGAAGFFATLAVRWARGPARTGGAAVVKDAR